MHTRPGTTATTLLHYINLSFKTILTPVARRVTFPHNSQRQDHQGMSLLNTYSLCNFKTYSQAYFNGRQKALEKESSPLLQYHSHHLLSHADREFSITNNVFVRTLSLQLFYQRTSDLFSQDS